MATIRLQGQLGEVAGSKLYHSALKVCIYSVGERPGWENFKNATNKYLYSMYFRVKFRAISITILLFYEQTGGGGDGVTVGLFNRAHIHWEGITKI